MNDLPSASAIEQPGALIDRYKLLEQIGEGGMGTIWMAEQREPVRRRVALKIIKLGMDTKQVIARFEAERQALAMMDHPHIAKVLDAGATETGRPYFVMEYIKGIQILEYCDKERLDTTARLKLFTSVCHAIQHAHQKGIIHRDIKPSNVLVTLHDGTPVPKVIDFGIAKATNSELTAKTLFTEHRQMIGTPAYMSPEQAEMSGLDIDTRSDIYSLGVLLYELLTGTTPFDMKALLESGFAEMMRAIREDEPHKPSSRISTLGDTASRTAQQRLVDVKKLGTLLRGDLDWIVMKCLEKNRTRRYETANGLAADITRHLHDEPVTAGAPSAGYKLRKFVKRNRAQVIAGGAVVVALLIGVLAFAWQAQIARDQRDIAESARKSESEQRKFADEQRLAAVQQRQAAEAERDKAELIAEFMSDTLQGAGPSVARGRDITMLREMMDSAAARIENGDLKAAPEAELRLRGTIGDTYRELAVFDAAQKMLEPALALARATHAGDHEATADALNRMARLRKAQGDLRGAEPIFRESLEMRRRLFPGDHPSVAQGLNNLVALLIARGNLAEAEPLIRECVAMHRHLHSGDHPDTAIGLNNLAELLRTRGDLAGAEPLYRESLEMTKRLFPGDYPGVAVRLDNMAKLLQARGDLRGAEPLMRESVEMRRRLYVGDHPDTALGLSNLAALLYARGDPAGAEPFCRESLEMNKRLFRGDHPELATDLERLAVVLEARGDLAGAESLYREALEMKKRLFRGERPDETLHLTLLLATRLQARGDPAAAEQLYREVLGTSKRVLSGDSLEVAGALNNLAVLLQARHELAGAEPLYREALEMMKRLFPGNHPNVAIALNTLAELLHARGDLAGAEPLYVQALDMLRLLFTDDHPDVLRAKGELADLYMKQGETDKAVALLNEVLGAVRATLPKSSPELAGQLAVFGLTLLESKAWAEAEALIREALTIREQAQPDVWTTFNTKSLLGGALLGQKRFAEAEPLLLDGYRGMKAREANIPLQGATRIPEALERLVQLYEARGNASEVAAWRSELATARASSPKPATDGSK